MILNCSSLQPDMPLSVPNHWLVPAVVALTGQYIFLIAPEFGFLFLNVSLTRFLHF